MKWLITLACAHGHRQELRLEGVSQAYAANFASLLDGTSAFFVQSPVPLETVLMPGHLGKCGICESRFTATVTSLGVDDQ
jgi:hypothetical protein